MKMFLWAFLPLFPASFCFAQISGDYIEARTADVYTGPCFANGEVGNTGDLAVFGWKIAEGAWEGVSLEGLSVIGVVRASWTLGDISRTSYPVKSVLIVDERANAEQRLALRSFAQHMGGDLLQNIVRVDYQPVTFAFADNNLHSGRATLTAGNLARIETRSLNNGDHMCGNEETWYPPLTKLDHAMPVYTLTDNFSGQGLGTTWSRPFQRSGFVGTFHVN
jgi:hypothetical protein